MVRITNFPAKFVEINIIKSIIIFIGRKLSFPLHNFTNFQAGNENKEKYI